LVTRRVQIVWKKAKHGTCAFNLNAACSVRECAANGVIVDERVGPDT
jgi:hypothetical protein